MVVRKIRFGSVSTTDLHQQLSDRGIDTLVLTGISTSGVVLSTLIDAADRDYRVYVLSDGVADPDRPTRCWSTRCSRPGATSSTPPSSASCCTPPDTQWPQALVAMGAADCRATALFRAGFVAVCGKSHGSAGRGDHPGDRGSYRSLRTCVVRATCPDGVVDVRIARRRASVPPGSAMRGSSAAQCPRGREAVHAPWRSTGPSHCVRALRTSSGSGSSAAHAA
ncbi:cysteine hydrolase family protein [Streptomyces sp. NPDC001698]|uniref:cysteine hydrolase family protein n=1 Tax=unclassified Streptomyces TaxID=2593676 RepID=UPI003696A4E4